MKKKLVEDNTFNTYCELVWECSEEEFLNYVNKMNGTGYKSRGSLGKSVYHENNGILNYFVWIKKRKGYEETLAHEVLHMIRFWLQDFQGINLSRETEEIWTLLHSFYFRELSKLLTL